MVQQNRVIELYEMDFDEMRTVEIFTWHIKNLYNGLLAVEEQHRVYEEKERKKRFW
jgi:hypothetical protein